MLPGEDDAPSRRIISAEEDTAARLPCTLASKLGVPLTPERGESGFSLGEFANTPLELTLVGVSAKHLVPWMVRQ